MFGSDAEVAEAAALLSDERLAECVRIAGSVTDAIALHQQCLAVSGALTPLLGLIEIALRNAVWTELCDAFDRPDWLTNPPAPFSWKGEEAQKLRLGKVHARRAIYAKLSGAQKRSLDALAYPTGVPVHIGHEARSKARQSVIEPSTGQLIAQLTLFFWKRLFSADYEQTLWKRRLRRLFPDKAVRRSTVAAHLEVLYKARNRIAHHEPILGARLETVLQSADFVLREFGPRDAGGHSIAGKMVADYRLHLAVQTDRLQQLLDRVAPPGTSR